MMLHLEMIEEPNRDAETQLRDFVTFEDELPAEVAFGPTGARERGTYCTDVKHETTDDN
jgi:hypothetical protein